MSNYRFGRDYELIITLTSGEVVKIIPELRVQFEVNKSINGKLNSCKLKIYNLSEDKRKKLIKDKTDNNIMMPFLFKAGYSKLETLFKGSVWEAFSVKQGADFITTINSLDGAYDYFNSYTSKTIIGNPIDHILNDMPNTQKGKISKRVELSRPRVLVGNSVNLIENSLDENETHYIDEEKLYILKDDEVISDYMPVVNLETGLLETPIKKAQELTFKTLLNPTIKIGGLVKLESMTAKQLNGIYKVMTIKYSGDNYGSDWSQECICMVMSNYKVAI